MTVLNNYQDSRKTTSDLICIINIHIQMSMQFAASKTCIGAVYCSAFTFCVHDNQPANVSVK